MAPILLLAIALPALAQTPSSSRPPRDLHRVGDHWTAYNPPDPATYPPGSRTHTIAGGDTLWGLAQRYYGNAYLWPQLWESNTWITDAHWIYPGDVLLVEGEATQTAGAEGDATAAGDGDMLLGQAGDDATLQTESTDGGLPVARIAPPQRPIPLGTEADVYCYGYIGHPDEPMPNYFSSIEDFETMYLPRSENDRGASVAAGELIYITGGTSTGLVPGETYIAVEPGDLVRHPANDEVLGREYLYTGQIRVLCADATTARAIVVQSCREINVGARLKPMPQLPIPIARVPDMPQWCDPPTMRQEGYIVDSLGWDLGVAEGNLVQIDLGSSDQVQPGDFFIIWRPSPIEGQPRQVIGELGILTTEANTATAKIVASRTAIQIGDRIELR